MAAMYNIDGQQYEYGTPEYYAARSALKQRGRDRMNANQAQYESEGWLNINPGGTQVYMDPYGWGPGSPLPQSAYHDRLDKQGLPNAYEQLSGNQSVQPGMSAQKKGYQSVFSPEQQAAGAALRQKYGIFDEGSGQYRLPKTGVEFGGGGRGGQGGGFGGGFGQGGGGRGGGGGNAGSQWAPQNLKWENTTFGSNNNAPITFGNRGQASGDMAALTQALAKNNWG